MAAAASNCSGVASMMGMKVRSGCSATAGYVVIMSLLGRCYMPGYGEYRNPVSMPARSAMHTVQDTVPQGNAEAAAACASHSANGLD
jgi:hypothetical protein